MTGAITHKDKATQQRRSRGPFCCQLFLILLYPVFCRFSSAAEPLMEKTVLFTERADGFTLYRIPGITTHPGHAPKPGPLLLFSNPHTTEREHAVRRDVTIHLSRDDGLTRPVFKTLQSGPSAYSDLAVLLHGWVLCFYESGTDKPAIKRKRDWAYANLTLARFNFEWITTP